MPWYFFIQPFTLFLVLFDISLMILIILGLDSAKFAVHHSTERSEFHFNSTESHQFNEKFQRVEKFFIDCPHCGERQRIILFFS